VKSNMHEGDCVKILAGQYAGEIGTISMIESGDVCVAFENHDPVWYKRRQLDVIECEEND
jgi:hypothetical protein